MNVLKTVEDHEAERRVQNPREKPQPTGVACPVCGAEMVYTGGGYRYTGHSTREALCPSCNRRQELRA